MADRRICIREGCTRYISYRRPEYDTCSLLCQLITNEVNSAQSITTATGDGEHWASAVALNDALTAYVRSQTRVYHQCRTAGMDDHEWRSIRAT